MIDRAPAAPVAVTLKPCPLCGKEAGRCRDAVGCKNRDCELWVWDCDEVKWNARAPTEKEAALEAELMEQVRLNGMGTERELALMAKIERKEAILERLEGALKNAKIALSCCYEVVEWPADGGSSQDNAIAEAEAALTFAAEEKGEL